MSGAQTDHSKGYPKTEKTKAKYDAFCMAYHTNGNNGSKAAESVGYAKNSARQTAVKLLSNTYIQEKLKELQNEAAEEYTVTLEDRLKTLERVVEEGLKPHFDACGNKRALGLHPVVSAIAELNKMLGTTSSDEEAVPLQISFNVNGQKGAMTVTNAPA